MWSFYWAALTVFNVALVVYDVRVHVLPFAVLQAFFAVCTATCLLYTVAAQRRDNAS